MRQGQQNRRGRGRGRKPQNPLSRNFESNGPDVKIRGTAAHIAEKYATLARDALASGDVVGGENYLQHAEHYNRIIMAFQTQQDEETGSGSPEPSRQNGAGRSGDQQPDIAVTGNASGNKGQDDGLMRTLSRAGGSAGNGADEAGEENEASEKPKSSRSKSKGGSGEAPDKAVT